MKNKLLLITFFFAFLVSMGQSYRISPSSTLNESVVYNSDNKFKMYFTNVSNSSINLQWKVVSNNLVAGWDCFICDDVSCCKGVPDHGVMPYVDPGIGVFLALNVNPKTIPGLGTLKLYLCDEANPSSGDTLIWVINSVATGMETVDVNASISIFPNPASDYVMIDMSAYHAIPLNTMSVYNSTGQLLVKSKISHPLEKLDITSFPKGSYQLILSDDKKNRITKTVMK
jgi:hypothetical protein